MAEIDRGQGLVGMDVKLNNENKQDRGELIKELALLIVEAVNLRHVPVETITAETSLGPGGLNLDSVDILEIIITLEQKYNVKIKDAEMGKIHLRTMGTLADFISSTGT
jgi:acyl carrier protein